MRRIIFTFVLVLASVLASGVVAPLASRAHAQSNPYTSPTITVTPSTVAVGSTATVQGYAFTPNNYVFVYWQRPDRTTNGTYRFTDATGYFTFRLGFRASHGTGNEYVAGYDYGTGRWSPFFTVTVTSTTPPPTHEYLTASPNPVSVGGVSMVRGYAFSPHNTVYVKWTRPDGTTNAIYIRTNPSGYFTFQLGFLRAHGCGSEVLQAYDFGTATWSPTYTIAVNGC